MIDIIALKYMDLKSLICYWAGGHNKGRLVESGVQTGPGVGDRADVQPIRYDHKGARVCLLSNISSD